MTRLCNGVGHCCGMLPITASGKFSDKSKRFVNEREFEQRDSQMPRLFVVLAGNDSYSAVAFVLAILFVTISNVLLLNVLVALFK